MANSRKDLWETLVDKLRDNTIPFLSNNVCHADSVKASTSLIKSDSKLQRTDRSEREYGGWYAKILS